MKKHWKKEIKNGDIDIDNCFFDVLKFFKYNEI